MVYRTAKSCSQATPSLDLSQAPSMKVPPIVALKRWWKSGPAYNEPGVLDSSVGTE